MSTASSIRPVESEYAPYYHRYISLIEEGDILALLASQRAQTLALLEGLDETQAEYRYAEGKWSIKEIMGHLIDCERIYAARALWFGRGASGPLPGFDQDLFVVKADFNRRTLAELLREYALVRDSTIAMFQGFSDQSWEMAGIADSNSITVRAIAWVLASHDLHHTAVIRERYLSA